MNANWNYLKIMIGNVFRHKNKVMAINLYDYLMLIC